MKIRYFLAGVLTCFLSFSCAEPGIVEPEEVSVSAETNLSKKGGKPGDGPGGGVDPSTVNWSFAVADKNISLLSISTAQEYQLTGGRLNQYEATYTSDGNTIAYLNQLERNSTYVELRIVGSNGQNDRPIASFGQGSPLIPNYVYGMDWLPGSSKILFPSGNNDLAVIDTVGAVVQVFGLYQVFGGSNIHGASPGTDLQPSAPGFQGPIAFSAWDPVNSWSIYVVMMEETAGTITVDYDGMIRLETSPIPGSFPVFSPDGTEIVFTERTFNAGGDGLYKVSFDGPDWSFDPAPPITLTARKIIGPATWAPDGSWIAYEGVTGQRRSGGFETRLHIVRPDGSSETAVYSGGNDPFVQPLGPDWNPLWIDE